MASDSLHPRIPVESQNQKPPSLLASDMLGSGCPALAVSPVEAVPKAIVFHRQLLDMSEPRARIQGQNPEAGV